MTTLVNAANLLGSRVHHRIARVVSRPLFWLAFTGVIFAWPIARTVRLELPPKLPVLAQVPDFKLTDAHAQPFGRKNLEGKVWIANFIFTRCPTVCPRFTEKMAKVQHRTRNLGGAFHLVSFSVDPTYDTPERLADYAKRYRASPRRWSFLTGAPDELKATVVQGLKVGMGADDTAPFGIFHGSHFVLVDQLGRIRGYYDSSEDSAIDKMVYDIGQIVARG